MRPLLIGQAPAKYSEGLPALCGHSGRHLASLAGLPPAAFMAAVETRNLLSHFPGAAAGGGDLFPRRAARAAAERMEAELVGRRVLFVGAGVASVFGHLGTPPLAWHRGDGYRFAVIPHPSTVNRWWNDYANRRRAARFLREVLGVLEPEPEPLRLEL